MDYLRLKRDHLEMCLANTDDVPKDEFYPIYIEELVTELFEIEGILRQS